MNYKEVIFLFKPLKPWSEILIAFLSDLDFESFEEINEGVRAYIKEDDFNFSEIDSICNQLDCKIDINHKVIKQENWNAIWESNFHPIVIGNKCGIRADFHEPLDLEYEIIIHTKNVFWNRSSCYNIWYDRGNAKLRFSRKECVGYGLWYSSIGNISAPIRF